MKAQELRIGNYITTKFSTNESSYLKVDYSMIRNISEHPTEGDFIPIPLTEQWLKDFGFDFEQNYINRWVKDYCEMGFMPLRYGGYTMASDEYTYDPTINYVHQLQNLYFALTEKELIKQDAQVK